MELATRLTDIICRTMPSTAVASGFCSMVDTTSAEVERLMAAHFETIFAESVDLAIHDLREWLEARGEKVTDSVLLAFRKAAQQARMNRNSATSDVKVFTDTRAAQHAEAMAEYEAMQDTRNTEVE